MSKSVVRIVSCDTETSSLSWETGLPWQIGIAWADIDIKRGTILRQPIGRELEWKVPSHLWNISTLDFCKEHLPEGKEVPVDYDWVSTGTNTIKVLIGLGQLWRGAIEEACRTQAKIIWVFNHPDFDVPFIEKIVPDFKKIVGYSNIKDLQSLAIGKLGLEGYVDAKEEHKEKNGQPQHSALSDAYYQLRFILDNHLVW